MKIIKTYEIAPFENPHGVDGRKLFTGDNIQMVRLTLKPGQIIAPHPAPVNVFFYVASGKGICTAGTESSEIQQDTLIYSPAGTIHGWTNTGTDELKLLVCKVAII